MKVHDVIPLSALPKKRTEPDGGYQKFCIGNDLKTAENEAE